MTSSLWSTVNVVSWTQISTTAAKASAASGSQGGVRQGAGRCPWQEGGQRKHNGPFHRQTSGSQHSCVTGKTCKRSD